MRKMRAKSDGRLMYPKGLAISAGALALTSLIAAVVVSYTDDPTRIVGICSLAAMIAAALITGFSVSKMGGGIKCSALVSLTAVMTMLLASVLVGGGTPPYSALMNYLSYFGASLVGGYAAISGNGKRKRRHR